MSLDKLFPGVNFSSAIGVSDLGIEQQALTTEILERMKVILGYPAYFLEASCWGIVSTSDPSTHEEDDTLPLVVSSTDNLTLTVQPGVAVTKSGFLVKIESAQTGIQLSSGETGTVNIVTVKFYTKNSGSQSISEYFSTYKWRVTPSDSEKIKVYTLTEWNALLQEDKDDHVVIGIATVSIGSSGSLVLSIDLGSSSYSFNRPWFSAIDIKHRSSVGSGTVTTTNIHGIGFNELNAGNYTLPQLILRPGAIAARPQSVVNVPGRCCISEIPNGSIKTDTLGELGLIGAKYVELAFFPIRLGKVCDSSDESKEFSFIIVNGTNYIRQATLTSVAPTSENLKVYATRVSTLEPKVLPGPASRFEATAIQSTDLVLSGGISYTYESSVNLIDVMSDAGTIPMHYDFYFSGGEIVKNPQVLLCRILIDDIGSGISPAISPVGTCVILVALDKAAAGSSLSVKIRVSGVDEEGSDASEVFQFGSSWAQGATVPSCTTPQSQLLRGTTRFSSISSITLDEALNAGSTAAIQVWCVIDTVSNYNLSRSLMLARTQWDGTKLCKFNDCRTIGTDLQSTNPMGGFGGALQQAMALMDRDEAGVRHRRVLLVEDFRNPAFSVLKEPSWSEILDNRLSSSDGSKQALWGYYESRALPESIGEGILYIRLVPLGSSDLNERASADYPLPEVMVKEYTATGWGSWVAATFDTTTNKGWYWTCDSTASSFKLRLRNALGILGVVVFSDKTVA